MPGARLAEVAGPWTSPTCGWRPAGRAGPLRRGAGLLRPADPHDHLLRRAGGRSAHERPGPRQPAGLLVVRRGQHAGVALGADRLHQHARLRLGCRPGLRRASNPADFVAGPAGPRHRPSPRATTLSWAWTSPSVPVSNPPPPKAAPPLGPNPHSFGHFGTGGAVGFADPDAGVAFGYAMNHVIPAG